MKEECKNTDIFLRASLNDATTPNGYRKDLLFLIGFRVSKPSKDRSAKNHWPLATSKSKFNNWVRATPEIEQYFIHFPPYMIHYFIIFRRSLGRILLGVNLLLPWQGRIIHVTYKATVLVNLTGTDILLFSIFKFDP